MTVLFPFRLLVSLTTNSQGVAQAFRFDSDCLRSTCSEVFEKYSQMKLQMKREAVQKLERQANEMKTPFGTVSGTVIEDQLKFIWDTLAQFGQFPVAREIALGLG